MKLSFSLSKSFAVALLGLSFSPAYSSVVPSNSLEGVLPVVQDFFANKKFAVEDGSQFYFGELAQSGSMYSLKGEYTKADGTKFELIDTLLTVNGEARLMEKAAGGAITSYHIQVLGSGELLITPIDAGQGTMVSNTCSRSQESTNCVRVIRLGNGQTFPVHIKQVKP